MTVIAITGRRLARLGDDYQKYIEKLHTEERSISDYQEQQRKRTAEAIDRFRKFAEALLDAGELKRIITSTDPDDPHIKLYPLTSKDHVMVDCFIWTYNHPKYRNNLTGVGSLIADIIKVVNGLSYSYYYLNLSGSYVGYEYRTPDQAYDRGFSDVLHKTIAV